ncbi:MAG TPA: IS200/IS605 family transposase, partial [Dehalococcoidia bacterium]|nr:IS200/IS605 family transposase [Dehalococcoidia bacterium]
MPYFHIWFATKRRKWLLQGDVRDAAVEIITAVAGERGFRLLECEAIVDHVHLLLKADSGDDLPWVLNMLKGVSARKLFQHFPELKHDAQTASFWQRGYNS